MENVSFIRYWLYVNLLLGYLFQDQVFPVQIYLKCKYESEILAYLES